MSSTLLKMPEARGSEGNTARWFFMTVGTYLGHFGFFFEPESGILSFELHTFITCTEIHIICKIGAQENEKIFIVTHDCIWHTGSYDAASRYYES